MAIFATYAAYLAISIGLTIAAGSALSRSGRVFLTGALGDDEGLARAVSRLLVTCFYLLNLGFVTLTVSTSGQISGARQAFGVLFSKVGAELLVLGALYLASIAVFTRFRRRQRPGPGLTPGPAPPPPRTAGGPATPGPGGAVKFWRPGPGPPPPGPRQAVH
jgi:hypothetical protein